MGLRHLIGKVDIGALSDEQFCNVHMVQQSCHEESRDAVETVGSVVGWHGGILLLFVFRLTLGAGKRCGDGERVSV
jgi:hypothetical protein